MSLSLGLGILKGLGSRDEQVVSSKCVRAVMGWRPLLEDGQQPGLGQCWETRLPSSLWGTLQGALWVMHGVLWAGGGKTSQQRQHFQPWIYGNLFCQLT